MFEVVKKHLPLVHGYGDDKQLDVSFFPVSSAAEDLVVKAMESCIKDVRAVLVCNKLLFNASRTELLIIGSRKQLSKISISSIRVRNCDIKSQDSVRNFGSWFDNHQSMSTHIGKVCRKAFRGLYNIRQIRKYLSEDSKKTLIHAFVKIQIFLQFTLCSVQVIIICYTFKKSPLRWKYLSPQIKT